MLGRRSPEAGVAEQRLAGHDSGHAAHRAAHEQLLPVHGQQSQSVQRAGCAGHRCRSLSRPPISRPASSASSRAGNFGSDIAFWVDDDISVGGDNALAGLGDGISNS